MLVDVAVVVVVVASALAVHDSSHVPVAYSFVSLYVHVTAHVDYTDDPCPPQIYVHVSRAAASVHHNVLSTWQGGNGCLSHHVAVSPCVQQARSLDPRGCHG